MARVARFVCVVVFLLVAGTPSLATLAPPPSATGLSATQLDTAEFRWTAAAGATWYYLWVTDASGVARHKVWYTSTQAGCASTSICSVTASLNLLPGQGTWWVQTYSDSGGYGPWTAAQTFSATAPMVAVVAAGGEFVRGTAVSSSRMAAGLYEVIFARDVRSCVYNVSLGATAGETVDPASVYASWNFTKTNGIAVGIRNAAGTYVDRPFHATVICP